MAFEPMSRLSKIFENSMAIVKNTSNNNSESNRSKIKFLSEWKRREENLWRSARPTSLVSIKTHNKPSKGDGSIYLSKCRTFPNYSSAKPYKPWPT